MKRRVLVALLLSLGVVPLLAIPVAGRVKITGRAPGTTLPTIVYAEPLGGTARPQAGKFTLRQSKKAFQPRVLAISTGSTVQFPNDDAIFHNVFSLNPPEPFDLG